MKKTIALASVLLSAAALEAGSEKLTLTTSYPSPSGIYQTLVTTQKTVLGRDGGYVGIGVDPPTAKLHVLGPVFLNGALRLVNGSQGAGRILTSDRDGRAAWEDYRPIVCTAPQAWRTSPGNHPAGYSFTRADCGGRWPDARYVGMLAKTEVCGTDMSWALVQPHEGGPAVTWWCINCCVNSPTQIQAVFVRR